MSTRKAGTIVCSFLYSQFQGMAHFPCLRHQLGKPDEKENEIAADGKRNEGERKLRERKTKEWNNGGKKIEGREGKRKKGKGRSN